MGLGEIAAARCHLDWLMMWLPHGTKDEHWQHDFFGQNNLLRWWIYDETHEMFRLEDEKAESETMGERKC